MLTIDGSYGLGSGQLTRFALVFSALSGEPVTVTNIRSKRPQPGLKAQHMHAILALQQLCHAQVEGAVLGSSCVKFSPGKLVGGDVKVKIGTAGCIPLLLQNLLVPALFCSQKVKLTITGGTDVAFGPQIDYFAEVVLPFYKPYAQTISLEVKSRGYFPKGGGKVVLEITPKYHRCDASSFLAFVALLRKAEEPLFRVDQGTVEKVYCRSHASDYLESAHVAKRQLKGARKVLGTLYDADYDSSYSTTLCPGSGIVLWAVTTTSILGADSLGERGKKAELVGFEGASKLLHELTAGAAVDVHNADNLVPLLALLTGKIRTSTISEHTKTALWVVQQFMDVTVSYHDNEISVT